MKKHRFLQLSLVVVLMSVAATVGALSIDWFPVQASTAADDIDTLYDWLLIFSVPIFVGVMAVVGYTVLAFRAKPGQLDDGPPTHGSTRVELIWTIIPALIVTGLGLYGWAVLNNIEAKTGDEMKVKVIGQQFAWRFEYAESGVKSTELVLPRNKRVDFDITSDDVIHSFFVPATRLKRDAVKGITTDLVFTPTKFGNFPIICAELCGIGHATMRQNMRVVSDAEFTKWVTEQKTGGTKPQNTAAGPDGKAIFIDQSCSACHTLADAEAQGAAGPPLDGLVGRAKGSPAAYIRTAIVEPDKLIARGFKKGIMPRDYGQKLSSKEVDALVKYLLKAGK